MDQSVRMRIGRGVGWGEATEVRQEAIPASHKLSARRSGVRGGGVFFQPQAFRLYLPCLAAWSQAGFTTRFHCMLRPARCSAMDFGAFMRTTKGGRGDRNCLNLARRFSMSRLIGFSFQTLQAFRESSYFDGKHVSID